MSIYKKTQDIVDENGDLNLVNMELAKNQIIFVTIGVPFSSIPIAQKVMIFVDLGSNIAITQAAKEYRKVIADNIKNHGWVPGTRFDPSELYYEIFSDVNNTIPFSASSNSPRYNSAC